MESLSRQSQEMQKKTDLPLSIGEAVMASIGSDYAGAPLSDDHGIRVSIPGHPEIVAYKLRGIPGRDRTVDDLIEMSRRIKAQEVTDGN